MKLTKYILPALLSLFAGSLSVQGAVLDIGEELELEYWSLERDSGSFTGLRNRLRFYLTAELEDNIEIGARIQSAGIVDSTRTYVTYDGKRVQNNTPFFDLAYIKVADIHELPLSLTLGIQSLNWLDGILISDGGTGIPGALLEARAPADIGFEAYGVADRDDLRGVSHIEGRGVRVFRYFNFIKAEINYLTEKYEEGNDKVNRALYGANLTREMTRGLEFSLFRYLMEGDIGEESFNSSLTGAYGSFEGEVDPIGRGGAWIRYIVGSGDIDDERRGFMPILSNVSSEMIGSYYGRFRESGNPGDSYDLSHTFANLDLFSYGIYASPPVDGLSLSMTRSLYKSQDPSLPIGGALSLGASYDYGRVRLELEHTVFSPEDDHQFFAGKGSKKLLTLKAEARF